MLQPQSASASLTRVVWMRSFPFRTKRGWSLYLMTNTTSAGMLLGPWSPSLGNVTRVRGDVVGSLVALLGERDARARLPPGLDVHRQDFVTLGGCVAVIVENLACNAQLLDTARERLLQ